MYGWSRPSFCGGSFTSVHSVRHGSLRRKFAVFQVMSENYRKTTGETRGIEIICICQGKKRFLQQFLNELSLYLSFRFLLEKFYFTFEMKEIKEPISELFVPQHSEKKKKQINVLACSSSV